MMSRFPNGSPIKTDGQPHILATFNRPVTKQDLIGKVRAVFFDGTDVFVFESFASAQVEQENILVLKDVNGTNAKVEINIDGANLVENEDIGAYYFDIDFDGQHRKFFEKSSATYLMQLPNIIEQATPERYAVVRVTNVLETTGALSVAVLINTNNEPWSSDAELSDIDVAAFFVDVIALSSVENIVKAVLKMEYDIPSGVTFNVVSTPEQSVSIDGGLWNFFTDGSEFVPLVMTSRFPNGAPIKKDDLEEYLELEVARFNRTPAYYELAGLLKIVAQDGNDSAETLPFVYVDNNHWSFIGTWGQLVAKVEGNSLKVTNEIDSTNVWDIDFAEQNMRSLVLPSSSETLMFEVINPNILDNDTAFLDVIAYNDDLPYLQVVAESQDYVYASNGGAAQMVQMSPEIAISIIQNIANMEFTNASDFYMERIDYNGELPSGTVDLLTVTSITPA